ncbi:hypothetical protein F5X99DRAFT_401914 [Biscogniauxia marginata]|nr:hypothetical protein F5X99DRAFT_401914 [Biscogniauxia marginata]
MITTSWITGLVAGATLVSASTDELQLFSRLLKRQEPGTPAYNCHDNCGQAIIQARESADACNDQIFLTNYQNCIQCSGPENENIWHYYGSTLSNTGEQCGFSTEPLSGTQLDVGPAIPAGSSFVTSSSNEPASPTTSIASSTTAESVTTTTESPTTGATEPTLASTLTATEESSSLTSDSATGSVTLAPTTTGDINETGLSTTASETVVAPTATAAANALSVGGIAFYGALAFGALCVSG